MVVDCHHVACACGNLMIIPILKKSKLGLFFFSKLGKKSHKFHWEWGRIENKKIPGSIVWSNKFLCINSMKLLKMLKFEEDT